MWSSPFNYIEHYMTTFYKLVLRMLAASVVVMPVAARVEKARAFDPFGHAGFDPSGKIRMTP